MKSLIKTDTPFSYDVLKSKGIFASVFCVFLVSASGLRAQNNDRVALGEACPSFTLSTRGTKKCISASELKGSVTLINFFATWCGPCLRELPELNKKIWEIYKDNKAFNLMVIGRGHSEKEIDVFNNKYCYEFPMYADSSMSIYNAFANKYIPRNYIINREGKIVFASINYTPVEFEKILEKLREELK